MGSERDGSRSIGSAEADCEGLRGLGPGMSVSKDMARDVAEAVASKGSSCGRGVEVAEPPPRCRGVDFADGPRFLRPLLETGVAVALGGTCSTTGVFRPDSVGLTSVVTGGKLPRFSMASANIIRPLASLFGSGSGIWNNSGCSTA